MRSLQLVLSRGFDRDAVRVEIDGRVVLDEGNVTTKSQVEVAAMRQIEVDRDPIRVVISLPRRGQSKEASVSLGDAAALEIFLSSSGAVEHRTSQQPTRVM